jgi:hypothetical protein
MKRSTVFVSVALIGLALSALACTVPTEQNEPPELVDQDLRADDDSEAQDEELDADEEAKLDLETVDLDTVDPDAELDPPDGELPDAPDETETVQALPSDLSWQWQLTGSINSSYDVALYDLDLFDTSAQLISTLQAQGRRVLCYFSAGSAEDWRPDFSQYPSSALGKPLDGWDGERWVDVRTDAVRSILLARLELATSKGCDGVEPDNVDLYLQDTGFALTQSDTIAFNQWLARSAHERGLLIALKNTGELADTLEPHFDLSLNEECHEYEECDALEAFVRAGKPILNAEYAGSLAEAQRLADSLCPQAEQAHTMTLILPLELDDAFRVSCF